MTHLRCGRIFTDHVSDVTFYYKFTVCCAIERCWAAFDKVTDFFTRFFAPCLSCVNSDIVISDHPSV